MFRLSGQAKLFQQRPFGGERLLPLPLNPSPIASDRRVHGLAGTPAAVMRRAPATRVRSPSAVSLLARHGFSIPFHRRPAVAWGGPQLRVRRDTFGQSGLLSPEKFRPQPFAWAHIDRVRTSVRMTVSALHTQCWAWCPHIASSPLSVACSSRARNATTALRGYTKRRPLR
jgi:hypothetical protein